MQCVHLTCGEETHERGRPVSDAGVAADAERTGPRVWQVGRAVARLLAMRKWAVASWRWSRARRMDCGFGRAGQSARRNHVGGREPLKTFAGIPPIAYLVQRIGGPYVCVEVLVCAGRGPHIFEPTGRGVIDCQSRTLFFRVGMPFEDRLIRHIPGGPAPLYHRRYGGRNCSTGVWSCEKLPSPACRTRQDGRGAGVREVWGRRRWISALSASPRPSPGHQPKVGRERGRTTKVRPIPMSGYRHRS